MQNAMTPVRMRGFTLIELLVVLVILGLLAGLVGPQVMKYLGTANTEVARQQVSSFDSALEMYRLEVGRYPTSEQGLQALVAQPAGVSRWNGPYLKKATIPDDPWGNTYQYRQPGEGGRSYDVFSLGADGSQGGEGENADINSWE